MGRVGRKYVSDVEAEVADGTGILRCRATR